MALTKVTNSLLATPPTDFDDGGLQDDIALLGFKVASNGSLAKYNLVDQTVDDFQDASGVNTGGSTNEVRSSSNYYVGSTASTPTISGNYDSSTVDGDYTYYKWTTATSSGSYTTDIAQDYEYLVVAGGGGGGDTRAGGGGAGGMLSGTGFAVAATTISGITVGAGGAGATASNTPGSNGSDSVFSTVTSTGGGGGSGSGGSGGASDGGSGGGSTSDHGAGSYGDGTAGQGNDGADGSAAPNYGAGGGGGAGAAGTLGTTTVGGNGGVGLSNSITGSAVFYAGGGGGGTYLSSTPGSGGNGGGGDGKWNAVGESGTANTGGGGGGGGHNGTVGFDGGAGGSGLVVIRRPTVAEIEGGNMTLVSATTAAQAAPTKGDVVLTYTNGVGSTTLGTDITAEISADGGSTWTAMTLGSEGSTGSHNIATAHDVTISSTITAPYNMAYRIKTLNQGAGTKTTRIQAVSLGWS
jgi:hypothetical protein